MYSLAEQSVNTFAEAKGYLKILEKSMKRKSKFTNDLLYNVISLCTEKLFMALLSHNQINATHHTPMALFNEANRLNKLPEEFRDTVKLISKFESICQFDSFGYKTPADSEIKQMATGLVNIKNYIDEKLQKIV